MDFTHIARTRTGSRLHFADSRGCTRCSRRMDDLTPIAELELELDEPYCQQCLEQLVAGVETIRVFGVEGSERFERNFAEMWDGEAEYRVGEYMLRYLEDNPAPRASRVAEWLRDWAAQLQEHGRLLHEAAGGRGL